MLTLHWQCTFEAYVLQSKQSLAWTCICGYRVTRFHSLLCNALSPWLLHSVLNTTVGNCNRIYRHKVKFISICFNCSKRKISNRDSKQGHLVVQHL